MKTTFLEATKLDKIFGRSDVGVGAIADATKWGMGQLKLKAPPRFNGKRPKVWVWLVDIQR